MPLKIIKNDISLMKTDAIVNTSNVWLQMGRGVSSAIFEKAGINQMREACNQIGYCDIGEAVITPGFKLDAKYVIHTVGPIYNDGMDNEAVLLEAAYYNSLKLAEEYNCKSISFPLISAGTYAYPKKEALTIAINTITNYLDEYEMDVYLVVYNNENLGLSKDFLDNIRDFVDGNLDSVLLRSARLHTESLKEVFYEDKSLEDLLNELDTSFSNHLFKLIDNRGLQDKEVYQRANVSRKLFSKIRSKKDYHPNKKTAISLCLALKLDEDETADLLSRAGYALSMSDKFDIIVLYFIKNGNYDIYEINNTLFYLLQTTL